MKKKTVLIHSNFCKAFTGFGKNKKNILRYLFKTGKYELIELANGRHWNDPELAKMPWKCVGSLPEPSALSQLKEHEQQRAAAYGMFMIDKAIETFKPDVYIGIEDIWAFDGYYDKPWWKKVNSMVWTTLDSLPILQSAIDAAPKTKHYYVWASFAEKALKTLGYDHVKTLRGSLDVKQFYRIEDRKRQKLRESFGIENDFIIGFVFRNQLRKSVPNLLDGFKLFKEKVPNAKLLLHTHWAEGWDIPRLLEEKGIDNNDILTTYFCKNCKKYQVKPFAGQEVDCPLCGGQKTQVTTNITDGVNEAQLNEIYNLMDVYCHPFTSGGQEIPIQEAKLAELITLATSYSCGEDYCYGDSGGFPLSWSEYREPGTQFIKASTNPESIYHSLLKVYEMDAAERKALGKKAREFVIENCSIEAIGKQIEDLLDSMPFVEYDFDINQRVFNIDYIPNLELSNGEFVIDIHKNILNEIVDQNHTSFKHWAKLLGEGMTKQSVAEHFKNVAINFSKKPLDFDAVLDKDDEGNRIAVVVADSEVDVLLVNGLVKNLSKLYPKQHIYILTRPENFQYIEDNPFVHKCIPYSDSINNAFILEGMGEHKGYFNMAFFPTVTTQKFINYIHNGQDKTEFQLQ